MVVIKHIEHTNVQFLQLTHSLLIPLHICIYFSGAFCLSLTMLPADFRIDSFFHASCFILSTSMVSYLPLGFGPWSFSATFCWCCVHIHIRSFVYPPIYGDSPSLFPVVYTSLAALFTSRQRKSRRVSIAPAANKEKIRISRCKY